MKVLVTGASGFVGNHIIYQLLQIGCEIIATSANKEKAAAQVWFNKVEYKEYKIKPQFENLNLFDFFERPDVMIHLAWEGLPNYNSLVHFEKNLYAHYFFLKNLVQHGIKKINVTGTCLEYGMQNGCLNEDLSTYPSNSYALAKDTLRKSLLLMQKEYKFDYNWIRLFYMYGPGQNPKSLIPLLQKAVENGEAEFFMSGGEQLRDYLPIERVAENIVAISLQNEIQGIVNCCNGAPISVRHFVEQFIINNNYKINLRLGHYPYPDYEPMAFWGDNQKLNKIIQNKLK